MRIPLAYGVDIFGDLVGFDLVEDNGVDVLAASQELGK